MFFEGLRFKSECTSVSGIGRLELLLVDDGFRFPEVEFRICEVVVEGHIQLPVVLGQAEESSLFAGRRQAGEFARFLALGRL